MLKTLLQTIIYGLAIAFIVLVLKPDLLRNLQPKVVIKKIALAHPPNSHYSYAEAVSRAAPSVVNIYSSKLVTNRTALIYNYFGHLNLPTKQKQNSLGSGVIISSQGYLLTNFHLIEQAHAIIVQLSDGRGLKAKIVGVDIETDLAVLKVEEKNLPSITLGFSDNLRVGDIVLAIGNPFGVGKTVTMGIISATGRTNIGSNKFESYLQTDAAINPGNSGGALINSYGELIGINTIIYSKTGSSHGLGFAIPIQHAAKISQQIIENGHPIRGWLGIIATNLSNRPGIIIKQIIKNSPAAKADLQKNDIISTLNQVEIKDATHFLYLIKKLQPNDALSINIIRNKKILNKSIKIATRPTYIAQPKR